LLASAVFLYNRGVTREPSHSYLPQDWRTRAQHYELELDRAPLSAEAQVFGATPLVFDYHEGVEVGIVLSGEQERLSYDTDVIVRAGEVWLNATWEPHGWRVVTPVARAVVLIFLPEFLGEGMLDGLSWLDLFAARPSLRPRVTTPRLRERVLSIGRELWEDIRGRPPRWQAAVRVNLLRLFLSITRDWTRPSDDLLALPRPAGDPMRIMPAVKALQAQPSHRLSLAEAAAQCRLSPSRFSRVFRETMGVTFATFCLRARLAGASHLLVSTDLGLDPIAEQTGFADASHLHHAFTKQYQCTPAAHRRRFRESASQPGGQAL